MAIVRGNLLLSGVSGAIGRQVVVRQTRNGVVLAHFPSRSSKPPSEAQLQARARFGEAVTYAKSAAGREEYQDLAAVGGTSAFAIARRDFLTPPKVQDVDVARYRGLRGDVIEVRATDDVKVVAVTVRILAADGNVVEGGEMVRSEQDAAQWIYEAGVDAPAGHMLVEVVAEDLAGNRTSATRSREV